MYWFGKSMNSWESSAIMIIIKKSTEFFLYKLEFTSTRLVSNTNHPSLMQMEVIYYHYHCDVRWLMTKRDIDSMKWEIHEIQSTVHFIQETQGKSCKIEHCKRPGALMWAWLPRCIWTGRRFLCCCVLPTEQDVVMLIAQWISRCAAESFGEGSEPFLARKKYLFLVQRPGTKFE